MRPIVLTCLFLLCSNLLCPPLAWARFGVEPRLGFREEYDDNIFLTPDDEDSDFITTISPGLALQWDTRPFTLELDYGLDFLYYRDHSEFDESSVGDIQRAKAEAEILPGRSFSVKVLDVYERVPVDLRRPTVETNPVVNKTNVNHFFLNPSYRLGKLPALQTTLGYRYERFDYSSPAGSEEIGDDTDADDNLSHIFTLEFAREMSSRLTLTVNAAQEFHQADINDDFRRQDLTAGFTFKVGPRLTLRGRGGMSWIDFKDRGTESSGVWLAGADLEATPRLKFNLEYSENFSVQVDDGLSKTRQASWGGRYDSKIKGDFRLFARESDYQEVDRKDREAGGSLSLRLPLFERLDLLLNGRLAFMEFLPEHDNVRRISAGGALEYRQGRFTVSLGYNHYDSRADQDFDEYRGNTVFLLARVTFWRSLTEYQDTQISDEPMPSSDLP